MAMEHESTFLTEELGSILQNMNRCSWTESSDTDPF